MSTVSLGSILAGAPTDGGESGRAAGGDDAAFGAALTAAARLFEPDATHEGTSEAERETAPVVDGGTAQPAADASAAAAAALLAAQVLPAVPVDAASTSAPRVAEVGETEMPTAVMAEGADADTAAVDETARTFVLPDESGAAGAEAARAAVSNSEEGVRDGSRPTAGATPAAQPGERAIGETATPPASAPAASASVSASAPPPSSPGATSAGLPGTQPAPASRTPAEPDASATIRTTGDAPSAPAASAPTPAATPTTEAPEGASPAPTVPAASAPSPLTAPTSPVSEVAPSPAAHRAIAAQVAPVVVAIAQRPEGAHQLTLTVNPDTFGPVTVRAQIGQGGDVQVQLLGATDAGREALKAIVADLRRDLSAVMPHAALSLGSGTSADAGADGRGTPTPPGGHSGDRPSGERSTHRAHTSLLTGGSDARPAAATPILATAGAGLDIFV